MGPEERYEASELANEYDLCGPDLHTYWAMLGSEQAYHLMQRPQLFVPESVMAALCDYTRWRDEIRGS